MIHTKNQRSKTRKLNHTHNQDVLGYISDMSVELSQMSLCIGHDQLAQDLNHIGVKARLCRDSLINEPLDAQMDKDIILDK